MAATLVINETYSIKMHVANARIQKASGQSWPMTVRAQESSSYDAGETLAYIASMNWPYTVTGDEKVSRSTTNWDLISDIERTIMIKIYEYIGVNPGEVVPVPTENGTIFIEQADWDRMTFDTLVDLWAWGTYYTAWTTPRIRMPLKLICAIGQAEIAEAFKCSY